MFRPCLGPAVYTPVVIEGDRVMTTPIVLSAIVGGGVSFLVVVLANFYRETRGRRRSVSKAQRIWD